MSPHGSIRTAALLLFLSIPASMTAQQEATAALPDTVPLVVLEPRAPARIEPAARPIHAAVAPGPTGEQIARRALWHQARARNWQAQHHTWGQRGGYRGAHIPDEEFLMYYGRAHPFQISRLPSELVGGRVRFQYGRFWFALEDPWPEYWPDTWYDTDVAYLGYFDDGYYLFNESRRGVRVAVEVIPD
jgi:hypothetical protein